MIIGLAGPAGSGKSTISKYLCFKYNFYPITFSDILIEEALKRKIIEKNFRKDDEKIKNILSKFGKELRKETGKEDILAIKIVEKIKRLGLKRVCVDGFRSKEEVEYFRKNFKDFYLISVKAEKEKRIERRKNLDPNFDIKDFEDGNLQNWEFILIRDENAKRKIAEIAFDQSFIEEADVIIVACSNQNKMFRYGERGEKLYAIQNVAAAIQNILLAASYFGIGSCWVGAFDSKELKKFLELPENIMPHAIIPLGYPNEKPNIPKRIDWKEITFSEKYNKKYIL